VFTSRYHARLARGINSVCHDDAGLIGQDGGHISRRKAASTLLSLAWRPLAPSGWHELYRYACHGAVVPRSSHQEPVLRHALYPAAAWSRPILLL